MQNKQENKHKILFIITKSNWGGAQRYVYDLATNLPRDRFEIVVAFGGTGQPNAETGALHKELEQAGIRTIILKYFARDIFLLLEIRAFFELISIFRKEQPHIVHLNSSKAGGLGALAARIVRIPNIIFTSHGLVYEENRLWWTKKLMGFFTWMTFTFAHTVILISRDSYEKARMMPFVKNKMQLIHNGIQEIKFIDKNLAREELQRDIGMSLKTDTVWIGTISELTKNKGLLYLLETCARLKESGKDFICIVIGAGEDGKMLQSNIINLELQNTMYLTGYIKDAARYLKMFDIFTLTSTKEGHPYTLLEAAQAKLPVVASDIPGITDIIEHNETGLLSGPKNVAEIKANLENLLENTELRKRYGNRLERKVKEQFSFQDMLDKTFTLYLK